MDSNSYHTGFEIGPSSPCFSPWFPESLCINRCEEQIPALLKFKGDLAGVRWQIGKKETQKLREQNTTFNVLLEQT